ncbi:MAG: preprotein translocase subunit SecD [Halarchaeum sp.]
MAPSIRENWRVAVLIVLLLGSLGALFVPGAAPVTGTAGGNATAASSGPTNLQYGLQLSGGTRVRAPVVGLTAEDLQISPDQDQRALRQRIAANLTDTSATDVKIRIYTDSTDTIEVFSNVSQPAFRDALDAAGVSGGTVRDGVTEATRSDIVDTLSQKVNALGFSGARVSQQSSIGSDTHYIVIEAPNTNLTEVYDLVRSRGQVHVDAYHPVNDSAQVNDTVLTNEQLQAAQVSNPTTQQGFPVVPVTLTDDAARSFSQAMRDYGYTSEEGISNCQYPGGTPGSEYCLLTVRDGKVVYSAGVARGLANDFENGDFQKDPTFVLQTSSMSEARQVAVDLRAGALPASLDLQKDDVYHIDASLAQRFKPLSFITGLIATLVVSLVVYLRYGRVRVAAPMVVTALSEVIILLGFSSLVGLSLNLSHIAGFIAVIGTGVDDLVIIADEVTRREVSSQRVFQSRFRKAFWVIGGAAATTIIAMSPLAFLSLGDLRGFAIVTILGVLVGVLLTRPAYGDILRYLITDQN